MDKFYSEFALVTRIKFPFFPRPNLIFYKPYVTSRNGPLMHNTTAYTSHIQNKNTWVIVEYHNELWDNSKSSYTLVWATEKKVQELLSKSVHVYFSCISFLCRSCWHILYYSSLIFLEAFQIYNFLNMQVGTSLVQRGYYVSSLIACCYFLILSYYIKYCDDIDPCSGHAVVMTSLTIQLENDSYIMLIFKLNLGELAHLFFLKYSSFMGFQPKWLLITVGELILYCRQIILIMRMRVIVLFHNDFSPGGE